MQSQISFKNDYSEGAHPEILNLLTQTNLQQEPGYGDDTWSLEAKDMIRAQIGNPDAEVYFVSGGTQANLLVISHLLKPYESVIAADTGHIQVHETGAIENCGHKINLVPHAMGKIDVAGIDKVIKAHTDHHMVKPAMVYLSQSTELGSIYNRAELEEISNYCRANNLKLFIDGARLAVALTSSEADLTLPEFAALCDVFYIGATKNGGLLGEAIVFNNAGDAAGFPYYLKQKGALMAKGRLLGVQFHALFRDGLYFELAKHANAMARKLAEGIAAAGYGFALTPESNQLFPILPLQVIAALNEQFAFYTWEKLDDEKAVVRLVCSWATKEADVDSFIDTLNHR